MYQELMRYFLLLSVTSIAGYSLYVRNLNPSEKPSAGKMILVVSFLGYLSALVALTIIPSERFSLNQTIKLMNYTPVLNTYKRYAMVTYFENYHGIKNFWQNFIGNIILFIPMGFFLGMLFRRSLVPVLAIAALSSFAIETTQYIFHFFGYYRYIDVDDVLLNTFGAFLGFAAYKLLLNYITPRYLRSACFISPRDTQS